MAQPQRRTLPKEWLFIALGTAAFTVALYWWSPGFLETLDLRGRDVAFDLRPPSAPSPDVAIIAVDEKSVRDLGRWPWPRTLQAQLLQRAKAAGARVVALDIVYVHPQDPVSDKVLRDATMSTKTSVALGYFFRGDRRRPVTPQARAELQPDRLGSRQQAPNQESGGGLNFDDVEVNLPGMRANASGAGFLNAVHDSDGLIRKALLLARFQDGLYPSLSLKALSLYLDEPIGVRENAFGIEAVTLGDRTVPTDENGRLTLNFYGPAQSVPHYSAVDVLQQRLPPGALRDRLVFVGVTETGISDMRATPVDSYFPGVEIHGVVASNILQERYLVRDGRTILIDLGLIIVTPLVLIYLLVKVRSILWGAAIFIALGALIGTVFYVLFAKHGYQVGFSYPAVALVLSYLAAEGYRNLVMEKRARFLHRAFSTYLSPTLVTEMLRNPDKFKLGGEKRRITVLFSDIRGFTSLSEQLPPEQLVSVLNRYLSPMTEIVLSERGTLDKYMGDAIMAIYNAPVDVTDHPACACRSALRMLDKLEQLNATLTAEIGFRIDIGIGLNTGEAVVGNMGTELRFDYTAIGDAVNLAARLEGQNVIYGTHILASEETYSACDRDFLFRPLDLLRVKGKQQPVMVYELLASAERATPSQRQLAADFAVALVAYRGAQFAQAAKLFSDLERRFPDDIPCKIYGLRCQEHLNSPPGPEWDGVYVTVQK